MKKLLMALAIGMVASTGINAWVTVIGNKSDGEIKVSINYGGGGICSPQDKLVGAGQIQSIDTGICCTHAMNIVGTSGKGVNTQTTFNPPATGFGLSCRNFAVVVKNAANGSLVAEQA